MRASLYAFSFLYIICWVASGVRADRNITVDDFDRTRIVYSPIESWTSLSSAITVDRYGRTTTWTNNQGAFATFSFTGAHSIYYVGYGVSGDNTSAISTIRVSLDGEKYDVPENNRPQQPAQQILFYRTGLNISKTHTIIVQKTSTGGGHDLNVDAFIYTVPDESSQGNDMVGNSNPSSSSDHASMVGLVVGTTIGGVTFGALVATALTYWLLTKRQSRNQGQSTMQFPQSPSSTVYGYNGKQ